MSLIDFTPIDTFVNYLLICVENYKAIYDECHIMIYAP